MVDLHDLKMIDDLLDAAGSGRPMDADDPAAGTLSALACVAQRAQIPAASSGVEMLTTSQRRHAVRSFAAGAAAVAVVCTGGISAAVTGDPMRPVELVLDQMVPGRADKAPPPGSDGSDDGDEAVTGLGDLAGILAHDSSGVDTLAVISAESVGESAVPSAADAPGSVGVTVVAGSTDARHVATAADEEGSATVYTDAQRPSPPDRSASRSTTDEAESDGDAGSDSESTTTATSTGSGKQTKGGGESGAGQAGGKGADMGADRPEPRSPRDPVAAARAEGDVAPAAAAELHRQGDGKSNDVEPVTVTGFDRAAQAVAEAPSPPADAAAQQPPPAAGRAN